MVDNIGALVRRSSMGNPHEELEMLEVLGEGAYGAVRKARRRRDGQVNRNTEFCNAIRATL
jgi:hypothetical protein